MTYEAVPQQPDPAVDTLGAATFSDDIRRRLKGALAQRLMRGVGWSVAGGAISSASSLLAAILVARMLGAEKYGALGLIQSTLNTFIIFVGPAVGLTATKFIAELRHRRPRRAGSILGLTLATTYVLSAVLAVALIAGANYLAVSTYRAPFLAPLLRLAAIALFLSGINGAQTGALAGVESFRSIAIANLVKGITTFPLMWFGTKYYGIEGAVLALAAAALIGCVTSEILLRRALRAAHLRASFERLRLYAVLLLTFSLPAMLTSSIVLITMWLGNVLIVRQPGGYAEFGIFNAANQWRSAILFLPSMVVQPFLPMLSRLAGEGRLVQFRKLLLVNIAASSVAALGPSVVAILLSRQIMTAYGAAFAHARLTMVLVVLATLMAAPTMAIIQAMNSLGRLWTSAAIHVAWVALFLLALQTSLGHGAQGLASAYLVSYIGQLVLFVAYIQFRVRALAP